MFKLHISTEPSTSSFYFSFVVDAHNYKDLPVVYSRRRRVILEVSRDDDETTIEIARGSFFLTPNS